MSLPTPAQVADRVFGPEDVAAVDAHYEREREAAASQRGWWGPMAAWAAAHAAESDTQQERL